MLSNQFLAIPPDHPLAVELYDLVHIEQAELISENQRASLAGDRAGIERTNANMLKLNARIEALQDEYRLERDADHTCTVGMTTDARGYPVVKGRQGAPKI